METWKAYDAATSTTVIMIHDPLRTAKWGSDIENLCNWKLIGSRKAKMIHIGHICRRVECISLGSTHVVGNGRLVQTTIFVDCFGWFLQSAKIRRRL